MKLRFTHRAVENITEIANYLNERNPHAANRVRSAIDESLRYLTLFQEPAAHKPPRVCASW